MRAKKSCAHDSLTDEELVKRAQGILSVSTVLVMMSAWFVISNHCAIGATAPEVPGARFQPTSDHRQDADATECPFHAKRSAPQKQKPPSGPPCCKILRAVTANPAKTFARATVDLPHVDLSFARLVVFAPPKISFRSATLDTGPPGKTSFAELIRSMRAHAPPFLS
jgi:hypothetical protein